MQQDKIHSYIGFAIRANKVRLGVNAIASLKGSIPLLLLCNTASDNTKKEAMALAAKYHSAVVLSKTERLEDLFNKENCKLGAILDKSLAEAILNNLNEKFVRLGG